MQTPLHALIVHFPLAIVFLIPFFILIFSYMIHTNKMTPQGWFIVIGLQLVLTISGYVALETGETEEHAVEKIVAKSLIHEHEEASEIFVGSTVVVLVLLIAAFFLQKDYQLKMQLGIFVLSLASCFLAYRAGHLGGTLVYQHGAAEAYVTREPEATQSLLPTPEQNTSESEMPVNENESLKVDDNDYGNNEEIQIDDENQKIEN